MMKLNKLSRIISDSSLSLQERLFRPLVTIGLLGMTAAFAAGIVAGENIENLIFMGVILAILSGITYYSIRNRKIQFGAVGIAIVVVYVVLPFNFLTAGGVYGGAPIWFLFGVVYVCLVVENKIKYVFLGSCFVLCVACYYIAYYFPHTLIEHSEAMIYYDSLASLIIVSALTCGMVLFQNAIFRKENEIAQKQKKEIEELNKMQNNFFSSMSHEIRTPINTIIGLNEMILREDVSDEVAEDAKNIQNASKMLLALINDILDMSKMESGKMDIVPVTYNVGDMLSDIVNMTWVKAREKGLEFHIDVDPTMPMRLYGDEVRIKQVLLNVLNNAVKYTSEGSVTLSIRCRRDTKGNAHVTYSIADTGMGIKKENIPYLFSAFRRVDEEKNRYIEGTGLGLSIVKQLVDLMGGEIAVNSVFTKGSTFVITLSQKIMVDTEIGELNLETRHAINARKHYKQSFEAPKARVLIVDDNDTNLLVAEKLLRDTKVQIETAASGAECLKMTQQSHYNVILMDHLMPEMDGIECLHTIRSQTGGLNQETPVVVLTANAGSENQMLYKREGFDGYLLKPVTGIQLETELLKHLPRELVNVMNADGSMGVLETSLHTHNKKVPILISSESVCDLPRRLIDKYHVPIMPYRVVTEGGDFMDGVEAETEGILSYMKDNKSVRSEPPETAAYEEFFAEQLTKAEYVIHISIAKHVSPAYDNAVEASKIFDNVIVVDSGHLSSGMGLMVLRAAMIAAEGQTTEVILKELQQMRNKIRTSFIVDTTEYLARMGRVSTKINTLCQTLMLHPVLVLKNSNMQVGAIRVGTRSNTWKNYISTVINEADRIDTKILFITYAGLSNSELKEIEEQVTRKISFDTIIYQKATSTISINCGPGCFGLLYMLK